MTTQMIRVAVAASLLWTASVHATPADEARATVGDVFSSQGRPANTTSTTGTQGVQGNPNCPPPVINGIVPKNWSCRTGTQGGSAPPQRPWIDQFFFPSANAQGRPQQGYVEQFNSNGQNGQTGGRPTYPAPKYTGYVPYKPPQQQARPIPVVQPKPAPVYKKVLYGEGAVWWPNTSEWLKYKISLNVDANGKQAVTNIKLEGADKQKYENGGPVIVSLKGQRSAKYQFSTTGVWVKPNGKNSPTGKYFDTTDTVTLREITVQVQ